MSCPNLIVNSRALVNECLQYEIGFGRYQRELFVLSGLGWLADSEHPISCYITFHASHTRPPDLWLQGIAVLLPQFNTHFNPPRVEYTTLALYVGLICGAVTWGSLSDIIGRKLSWQITLCIAVRLPHIYLLFCPCAFAYIRCL